MTLCDDDVMVLVLVISVSPVVAMATNRCDAVDAYVAADNNTDHCNINASLIISRYTL